MKSYCFLMLILVVVALIPMLPACSQNQSGSEKIMDKVGDALDKRPNERVLDAAEERAKGTPK
ncbi:hypothetical protein [Nitrosomonas oligotropha]|uniref:Uncharacterized protein n=1 Tax=Nitrosomonas oligotropha TaxID=42354 RepID=A0A1H8Q735_9PROT|nr:hypothetical protein [Nitrosomonas oligotropha]SDW70084.1 hypothetical protein SAMN05216300_10921 [Nitrosomonas oligotropha]SEO49734.1 hypothetical protein SAMN05216333_11121 [Nitrosomonas oligotropha]